MAQVAASKESGPSIVKDLSPFSKMVYDQTAISFRYPTPDTPGVTPPSKPTVTATASHQVSPAYRNSPKPRKHGSLQASAAMASNEQAFSQNQARSEGVIRSKAEVKEEPLPTTPIVAVPPMPTPSSAPPELFVSLQDIQPQNLNVPITPSFSSLPTSGPEVTIPPAAKAPAPIIAIPEAIPALKTPPAASPSALPPVVTPPNRPLLVKSTHTRAGSLTVDLPQSSINRDEYLVIPDYPDEPPVTLSAKKRKREEYEDSQEILGEGLDQRQRANGTFQDLHRFVEGIFEAESDLAQSEAKANALVVSTTENEVTMASNTHSKLQKLLEKAMLLGCYQNVPLDDLLHLMRLSEGAMNQVEAADITFDDSWGETATDAWLQQFADIDLGLRAARTALRLMCGGRSDKQLFSEDVIQKALNLLKNVIEGVVMPLAELRSTGPAAEIFKHVARNRALVSAIFTSCHKLFSQFTSLVSTIDTSETVITTLEFASSRLIFIETANAERDSVVEIQKFDSLRLVAMDILSHIFLLNPDQRQGIFDDILTSLEKLPVGKQRARQFKLIDGRSIQPVSALIMRLVQASAGTVEGSTATSHVRVGATAQESQDGDEEAGDGEDRGSPSKPKPTFKPRATINTEDDAAGQPSVAIEELGEVSSPLVKTAERNASYVINYLVNRALKATKSGDTPYRNLLDLFVEDFTSCLDSPDWPAAELLLRLLVLMMLGLVEGEKTAAPAKNMALEILGTTAAAISRLRSHVRKTASALDAMEHDELGAFLSELAAGALESRAPADHMIAWSGPYRATLEYLNDRFSEDPHLTSAISYIMADWADKVGRAWDSAYEAEESRDAELGQMAYRLRMMLQNRRWLSDEYTFKAVSPSHAKLAFAVTLLRSQLCESFNAVLNVLIKSMASEHSTVRSKSLKSITTLMETDPSILDGDSVVVQLILQCSNDSSPQVRDSAVGLIGKSLSMRPNLEEMMIPTVIQRFVDTGAPVRKRAVKLARDLYLRNSNRAVRSGIANGLLHRIQDPEESVRDLSRQMVEEIWFAPFQGMEPSPENQTALTAHVTLMVQTVRQGSVANVMDKVLQSLLAPESKTSSANAAVCRKLVASMFDLVDNPDTEDPTMPSGRDTLQVLMVFAKADPNLFTFEQIRLLKPHITTLASSEDMAVARAVVVIYRRVLPQLSSIHTEFLIEIRNHLMRAVSKVARSVLDDVMACLWIISEVLGTSEHLARLVCSSLIAIHQKFRKQPLQDLKMRQQFTRYSLIVGMAGKHCDLDSHGELFRAQFTAWDGTSTSKLMVDVIIPFASPSQPMDVRKAALDAVGLVCQSNPRNYVSIKVYTAFQQVLTEREVVLESMILRSLKEFLLIEEKRSEEASQAATANGEAGEKKRELTVMGGTSYDDVASATTQRFLQEVTRIALGSLDEHAFLAVEILATINRQGLVHPKETGVTFITLETAPMTKISELAFLEHKALHEKHETVLEREYIKAIGAVFSYQRDVAKDPHGATTDPFAPKLHLLMEVLKVSRSKNRQRFLEKLCALIDFDIAKLDVTEALPAHVQFSRFVLENMAFFEYITVGELQGTVAAMEKLVGSTGAALAHLIESEVFQVRMDAVNGAEGNEVGKIPVFVPTVEPKRMRQLSAGSMILSALWEARSYLRRLYSMGTNRRESKGKTPTKDLSRAPIKVQGVTGDKFWEEVERIMGSLASPEAMMEQCRAFVELLNVDKEFIVPGEDEDLNAEDPATPDQDDDEDIPASERGRKRKASTTPGSKRKRPRSSSQPRKRGRPSKAELERRERDRLQRQSMEEDADADGDFEEDWM
jgi:cohesin loading factor subunit SCC2